MRVAVLMGGPSPEHDVSILSGKAVMSALLGAGRDVLPVVITQRGQMIVADDLDSLATTAPVGAAQAIEALRARGVEACFLALHGKGGEDGAIQGFLDWAGMPYTGAGLEASALAMNKRVLKALLIEAGLPTPAHISCSRSRYLSSADAVVAEGLARSLLPGFVKVASAGSSFGVTLVRTEDELRAALTEAFKSDGQVVWEKLIEGPELTVALAGDAESSLEAFPVVEIRPRKGEYFDLASKYDDDGAYEICPAPISAELATQVTRLAEEVHRLIGARGMSRTDFIAGPDGPMILETNTTPGLTPASIFPKALAAVGRDPADFFWSLLEDARTRPLYGL